QHLARLQVEPGEVGAAENAVAIADARVVHDVIGVGTTAGERVKGAVLDDDPDIDPFHGEYAHESVVKLADFADAVEICHALQSTHASLVQALRGPCNLGDMVVRRICIHCK